MTRRSLEKTILELEKIRFIANKNDDNLIVDGIEISVNVTRIEDCILALNDVLEGLAYEINKAR